MAVSTDRRRGINSGAAIKVPVKAASTANLTLSGEQTVDGVALVEGDRCFCKNQTDASENGIYDVSTGSWRRSPDFDGEYDVVTGTLIGINQGSNNAGLMYKVTNTGDIDIGTTNLTFDLAAVGGVGTTTDLVNHSSGLNSQTVETVKSRFNRVMYITDFINVDPTGVSDSTSGIQTARDFIASLSNPVKLIWPQGIYKYSTSPNWAIQGLDMEAQGDVRLRYTGSGNAVILDGGSTGGGVFDIRMGRFYIEALSTSQNGVYMRAVHHGVYDFNVRGCGTTYSGLLTEWCVLNKIRFVCSVNQGAFYDNGKPTYGIRSSDRSGTQSAYNQYINPIVEGVGTGIYLEDCVGEQLLGGASEGNTVLGLQIASGANLNVIRGMDFEANAGGLPSGYDVEVGSWQNMFENIASDSRFVILSSGRYNRVHNSSLFSIDVNAGAILNCFNNVVYDRHGIIAGSYTDNGTDTITRDLINLRTNTFVGAQGRACYDNELTTTTLTVGTSPWTYTNTTDGNVSILLTGGIITQTLFRRTDVGGKTTYFAIGSSDEAGNSMYELAPTDGIQITYTAGFPPQAYLYTR